MQWFHGDHTMLEMIEKKRCLCKEIKARQKTEKGLCKQDSMPILPSWKKNTGAKKYSPPPYAKQQTVFWDTAIWGCTGSWELHGPSDEEGGWFGHVMLIVAYLLWNAMGSWAWLLQAQDRKKSSLQWRQTYLGLFWIQKILKCKYFTSLWVTPEMIHSQHTWITEISSLLHDIISLLTGLLPFLYVIPWYLLWLFFAFKILFSICLHLVSV